VTVPKLNTTDYTRTQTKAPTCTATGTYTWKWKTTTYGTFSYTTSIAAKGHSWGSWKTTGFPTPILEGVQERVCSSCSKKETQKLAKSKYDGVYVCDETYYELTPSQKGKVSLNVRCMWWEDGKLYIDMPLVYVPERRRGYDYLPPMGGYSGTLTYQRPYSKEELTALPAEHIVIAPGEVFLRPLTSVTATLTPPDKFRPQPRSNRRERGELYMEGELINFTIAENFDRQSAEYLGCYYFYEARQVAQLLPERREWYNYALMPLSAVGYVTDIPLSLATMVLTLPFSRGLSPHIDYSTTHSPEHSEHHVEPWHTSDN
jgi:hypothetical protein